MIPRLPPTFADIASWVRAAATAFNLLVQSVEARIASPFMMAVSEPANPVEGQVYYDTSMHKVRYWNGTAWVSL